MPHPWEGWKPLEKPASATSQRNAWEGWPSTQPTAQGVSPPAEPDWQAEQAAEEAAAQQIASQPWQITAPTLEPMADTSRDARPQPQPLYNPDPPPITEESAVQERRYAQFPLLSGDQRARLAQSAGGLDPAGRPYNPTGEVVPLPGEPGRAGYIARQSVAEALSPIADMAAGVPVRLASKLSGAVGGPTTDVADYPIAGALAQPVTPAEAGIRGASSIAGEVGSYVLPVGLPAASSKLAGAALKNLPLSHLLGFMAPVTASHANSPLEAAQGVARSPIDLVTSTVAAVPQTVENAVDVASNPTVENVQALTEAARPLAALPLFLRGNKRGNADRNTLKPTTSQEMAGTRIQSPEYGVGKTFPSVMGRGGETAVNERNNQGQGIGRVVQENNVKTGRSTNDVPGLPPDLLRAITGREPGTGGPVAPELQPPRPPAPADINPAAKPGGNVILPEPGQDVSGIPIAPEKMPGKNTPIIPTSSQTNAPYEVARRNNSTDFSAAPPAPSAPPPQAPEVQGRVTEAKPWKEYAPGETLPDGDTVIARGIKTKSEAKQIAQTNGAEVWIDGPRKWAVVKRARTAPPAVEQAQSPVETINGQGQKEGQGRNLQVGSPESSALQPAPAAGNVAPAPPETATKTPKDQPKFDAMTQALSSGKKLRLITQYKDIPLTSPDHIRMKGGNVQIRSGKNWFDLTNLQLDNLAEQAGFKAEAVPPQKPPKPRRPSRAGIGASEKTILDIHNKYRDVITGSAPEDTGRSVDMRGTEGEATAASGYTFADTPLNRSLVKEIRDRLPFNLHKQIRLVPRESAEGKYANGADIHADIGTDAMANAIKSYADRGRKRTIDRTVDFILSNPDKVTAEELYAAKIHKDISYSPETAQMARGKKPEVISTNNLGVGDKMEIGGESFTVKNIDGDAGTIDIKDGINYTLPLGADVAIDKGSLKAAERKATFDPSEFEDSPPSPSTPGFFEPPKPQGITGKQNALLMGGEDVTFVDRPEKAKKSGDKIEQRIRDQYDPNATNEFPFDSKEPPDSGTTLTSGPDIQRGLKLARHAVRGITDAWTRATGLASGATVATELKAIAGRQPGANQVHQILRNRSDVAAELHGQNLPQIEEIVRLLTKAERENAMLAFGGREAPINEKVAAAVEALRRHDEATSEIAASSGMLNANGEPWKPLKSDWINQEWNDKAVEAVRRERGPLWDKAVESVAETLQQRGMFVSERGIADKLPSGQGNSEPYKTQAIRFLRKNRSRILQDVRPLDRETKEYGSPSVSGSQLHRLVNWPREFLKPDLVESYIEHKRGLLTKSAEAMTVGPGGEKLAEAAAKTLDEVEAFARKRGVDIPAAKNYATQIMKEWFGRELGTREKVPGEGFLRKAQLASSILHLSAGSAFPAANLIFGMASNAFRHGLGRTLVASVKSIPAFLRTGEMYREAVRSGALDWAGVQGVIAEMHIPTLAKELLSGFAGATEAFNRTVAAEAGKSTVESAVQALSRKWGKRGEVPAKELIGTRQFRELIDRGFTQKEIFSMAARGEMTPAQVRKAMRGSVEVSQYLARPQDLPRLMTGPRSRAFFQFWPMAYKQTQNGVGKVLSEAGYGNLIPLARFLPLAIAAGYSVQQVRNLLYGERPTDKDKTMLAKMLGYLSDQTGVLDRAFQPFESGSKFVDTLNNQLTPVFVKDAENILNGVVKSVQEISAGEFPFKGLRKIASTSSAYKTAESIKTRLTGSPTPLWWRSSKPYDPNAKKEPPKSSFPLAPMRR